MGTESSVTWLAGWHSCFMNCTAGIIHIQYSSFHRKFKSDVYEIHSCKAFDGLSTVSRPHLSFLMRFFSCSYNEQLNQDFQPKIWWQGPARKKCDPRLSIILVILPGPSSWNTGIVSLKSGSTCIKLIRKSSLSSGTLVLKKVLFWIKTVQLSQVWKSLLFEGVIK